MSTHVHLTAIIEPGAQLDTGVTVGPYAVIGKHVVLGKNTVVHSHALIQGHTFIGEENQIFSFASVGNVPQDLKYQGEPTTLHLGNKNIVREYVTLQPGTVQGGGKTTIGHGNLLMAYVHVAHDCSLGNSNVLANGTQLAGHVTLHNMAVLGGLTAIHQFVTIGDMCMTAGGTMMKNDLPPYCMADGYRGILRGLNNIALQRRNIAAEVRTALKEAYKIIFMEQYPTMGEAIAKVPKELGQYAEVAYFLSFIEHSKRGVLRPPKVLDESYEF